MVQTSRASAKRTRVKKLGDTLGIEEDVVAEEEVEGDDSDLEVDDAEGVPDTEEENEDA